jgi:hypothetical protein
MTATTGMTATTAGMSAAAAASRYCMPTATAASRYCMSTAAAASCYCMPTAAAAASRYCMSTTTAAACIAATAGRFTATAAIAAAAAAAKPMPTPAVAIAPAGPWAHAQEDPVIEVSRPVKPIRRAGIRRIVVIAILANRLNPDADRNLRLCRRRQGHAGEQCCSTDNRFESTHM